MSQKTQITPNNNCSDWYLVSAREPVWFIYMANWVSFSRSDAQCLHQWSFLEWSIFWCTVFTSVVLLGVVHIHFSIV